MTLNYSQTCRLFAYSLYHNSGTTNVPDFWEDAVSSEIYSDTEYSTIRSWFLDKLTYLPSNLYGTNKQGGTFQITLSEISSSSNPPSR